MRSAAAVSTTDSIHSGRTRGASRSTSTARSRSGGRRSSSRIGLSREKDLQPITRSLHAHLERRYPDARDLRHLVVAQLLHVLEQKRLAVRRLETSDGAIDGEAKLELRGRIARRGAL